MTQKEYRFFVVNYINKINSVFGIGSKEAKSFRMICAGTTNLHLIRAHYNRLMNTTTTNNTNK